MLIDTILIDPAGHELKLAIWKANHCAPKKAKSFNLNKFPSGLFKVLYFSTANEGFYKINRNEKYPACRFEVIP